MGFFRRIGTILGFVKEEAHAVGEEDGDKINDSAQRRPGRGFSVQVPVAAEKPSLGPVIIPCSLGEGGVQGFRWYSRRLRVDEDGDVADEFLDEIQPPTSSGDESHAAKPRFEVKYTTRPAPVRKQAITIDGNVHPCMEHQGMLRWV
ncbi:hypothetical protein IEQ34_022754 [Dendrobium chrysotoxum]|uniref:Uncharacterized protein n=1 Tax=Dendrobium chrysotoxum TaxID=161865 RepID=A0AAV7FZV9_DENCH|nr:hypothetical protein IEQ34_022754 [Dendrobium chrysotoxum]